MGGVGEFRDLPNAPTVANEKMKSVVAGIESRWGAFMTPMRNFARDIYGKHPFHRWFSPEFGWLHGEIKSGGWTPDVISPQARILV